LADVRRRRSELVSAWREQSKNQIESARDAAALRAAFAWARCLEADAIAELRQQALQQAQAIEQTSRARVAAGSSLPSDAALALSELELARASTLDAEGAVTEAYFELKLATGQSTSTELAARGDLDGLDTVSVEPPPTREALERSPALKEARAQVVLARSQTDLVRATQGPSFTLGATFLREGTGARVYGAFVSLPLPVIDTAGFEAARERGIELRARANAADLSRELAKRLALAEHDRIHWREVRESLERGEAAARDGLRVLLANYETGVHDVSAVLIARQRVVSLQEGVTRASAELLRAKLLVRALTGRLRKESKP
jgi:outer membrane protein TolC